MHDLRIYYKSKEKIDEEFDKEMDKLAEKYGLEWYASGFNLIEKVRDIHFGEKGD